MAITNHERVGKALELVRAGLAPFVEREFTNRFKTKALTEAQRFVADDRLETNRPLARWDAALLLRLMWEAWNEVFRDVLGQAERTLVSELRAVRNKWAHQEPFSSDDAYRALDSAHRLLLAVSAPEAAELDKAKIELLRIRFDEQVRAEKRKAAGTAIETHATGALKPWRDVVTPHQDVASGRYQQAEFAADLWQVHIGEGAPEYRDPAEFFRRTFLTQSLSRLLVGAVQRLASGGGDPVVQLQTNFGGGKTHAMLALYHLFAGGKPAELAGIDTVLAQAGATVLPRVNRVVLVGNKISPGNPLIKPDGTVVRTLWGELAWQLGFAAGGLQGAQRAFARIKADDERATSPGDVLRELLNEFSPALILIDEWVAYARQLHDQSDLPAGSFETQFTFAQVLTESARLARNCLLVVSLPASDTTGSPHTLTDDVEVGGIRGREALNRLRNVIGRLEASWRPATAEEGFEIVRRRLFEPLVDPDQFKQRDVVARAFYDFYRSQHQEFPPECRDPEYEKRLRAAYPIHPEVFDRLYTDWSTLVKFQRTRGVLRLMASVIHSLWEKGDRNPLILPSTIPIDDPRVQFELTRYLSDDWVPVIDKDVDGPNSLPLRLDAQYSNLGKLHACRRVARAVYLGSAPTTAAAHRGIEDRRIKLGCVVPGEPTAVFGDALRYLASAATYLYQDGSRFWYATQPTVTKLAEDRAEQLKRDPDKVAEALDKWVRADLQKKGDFSRVHALPRTPDDVRDATDACLVVLGPEHPYSKEADSPAVRQAKVILESAGASPRLFRNAVVFLAPDQARLPDLDDALRRLLAWSSILEEKEALNLDPQQVKQAEQQKSMAEATVAARLPETFQWLLVPTQSDPKGAVTMEAIRLTDKAPLAVRASRKLVDKELLVLGYAGTRLRMELDKVLWRPEQNHVAVRQLVEYYGRYPYLQRLKNSDVLLDAIADGVGRMLWSETFAYADAFDESTGRYLGLRAGQKLNVSRETLMSGLVVKPEAARKQFAADAVPVTPGAPGGSAAVSSGLPRGLAASGAETAPVAKPTRFHGSVRLDPTRVGRDAARVAEEVISHLTGLVGGNVEVSLEINAYVPGGVPEKIVRVVTENARALKFEHHGFEEE
jgi:predicted AAA+ superfamily ATPase